MIDEIIGKYIVIENDTSHRYHSTLHTPVVKTDNCREAVWTANKDPNGLIPKNICGERDFYKGDDGNWHSFEL